MKLIKKIAFVFLASVSFASIANNIVYVEDQYMKQASSDLVKLVDQFAEEVGYTGNYELIEAKDSGKDINFWNRMVGSGINPITQNYFIVINPDWFNNLSLDAQKFLVVNAFVRFENGLASPGAKFVPFMFIILFLILVLALFFVFGQIKHFKDKKWWYKLGIAYLIMLPVNIFVLGNLQNRYNNYLSLNYSTSIDKLVLEKTKNKDAAIEAYESYINTLRQIVEGGESSAAPHIASFEKSIQKLKSKRACSCCHSHDHEHDHHHGHHDHN